MSRLRQECGLSDQSALPDDTALFPIFKAVAKRRSLIYGRLHDGRGQHCAIGAFWNDNPKAALHASLVDEVAIVNDSIPPTRWKKVNSWLRFKIAALAGKKVAHD